VRRTLRVAVVAGEASGDALGARVLAALRECCEELIVEGIGGPAMQAQGLSSLFPIERLSVMGFIDPLLRLPELLHRRRTLRQHFLQNPPDLFLGIDAPEFNLGLARGLRKRGVPTAQLVSPSVWAWRAGRIEGIGRAVDSVLCLFPFEPSHYHAKGIPAEFVGHPMADDIPLFSDQICDKICDEVYDKASARAALDLSASSTVLALLPGSRQSEIKSLAPLFLDVADRLSKLHAPLEIILPAADEDCFATLQTMLRRYSHLSVRLLRGEARKAIGAADVVLLASGTATLETALIRRPMVVAYRIGALSGWILSKMLRTEFIALPNILADKALVPEFLQGEASVENLTQALLMQLAQPESDLMQYEAIHEQLRCGFGARSAAVLMALIANERQ